MRIHKMQLSIYSIFDSAASAFSTPFFMQNDGLALRAFMDNVNRKDEESALTKHPDQFTLFRLGKFEDKTGKFEPEESPKSMGLAVEYIEQKVMSENQVDAFQEQLDDIAKTIKVLANNHNADMLKIMEANKD